MAAKTMVLEQSHKFVNAGEKGKIIRLSPTYTTHTVAHFPVPIEHIVLHSHLS